MTFCIRLKTHPFTRVLKLVGVLNYSSKEIGEKFNISFNTVDTHKRNILKKLNISTTGELGWYVKINKILV